MGAPRSCALSRLSRTITPAPAAGTNPQADALIGREARSGAWFDPRASTRMASKPDQMYGLAPSEPPQSMRSARPLRMRSSPSTIASVPVLQWRRDVGDEAYLEGLHRLLARQPA